MLVNRLRFGKGFHFWGFWIGWWGYFYTDDADYADLHGFFFGVCGVFLPRRSLRVFTKDAKVFLCW